MIVCILCADEDVELARENSKVIYPGSLIQPYEGTPKPNPIREKFDLTHKHLRIPVSETGQLPATHWFCYLSTDQDGYDKLVSNAKYSTIEVSGPKEFLVKCGLMIIR